jgi:hypothetical protein
MLACIVETIVDRLKISGTTKKYAFLKKATVGDPGAGNVSKFEAFPSHVEF